MEVPRTIEELKEWYVAQNLPPQDVTRFFIGLDYKEPKAFGIYKDENSGQFIVYKNKADGSRAIRYEGINEEYAVKELYLKLRDEIFNQKQNNSKKQQKRTQIGLIIFAIVLFMVTIFFAIISPRYGYYKYNNNYYYFQDGHWYGYSSYDGWYGTTAPSELKENHKSYYSRCL